MNSNLSLPRRRSLLGLMLASGLPAVHAAERPRFAVQAEPSLRYCFELMAAATQAAGFPADFVDAPKASEQRNLLEIQAGRIHINLLPATPTRLDMVKAGKIRMIGIPLERGLLGWRANFILAQDQDRLASVRTLSDLRAFVVGQGSGWLDAEIYRAAGLTTREVQAWREGEFAEQMQSGVIDLFPMGLEESLSHFLPSFRIRYPQLALDRHVLLRYPWYRFVWVSAHPSADALYQALQTGFDQIARNGQFESIWNQHRQLPPPQALRGRTTISLDNPFYNHDLVPAQYRHLLLEPQVT